MSNRCNGSYSFLFNEGKTSTCVEARTLQAIYEQHPDLKEITLSEVWCHGCANLVWIKLWGEWQELEEYVEETVVRHPPHTEE